MEKKHKLGPPVNLDKVLGKTRNRVFRVGVELEGGWGILPKGVRLLRDGSIRFTDAEIMKGIESIGELTSPPLAVRAEEATSSLHYPAWMSACYPKFVNESCGLHVHMSFKSAFTYQRLMTPAFPATILAYMTRWAKDEGLSDIHPIWPRLAGKNEYCQHTFYADDQVEKVDKDYDHHRVGNRYSVIVYPWSRHQTVECRLLPMLDTVEQAINAVKEILNITNAFLVMTAKREEKIKGEYCADEEKLSESKRIIV